MTPKLSATLAGFPLPNDLMYHTFMLLRSECGSSVCPTVLSQVCRSWRTVAIESAILWSKIAVVHRPPFRLNNLWIERSKQSPLSISIENDYDAGATAQLVRMLRPHVTRWQSLIVVPTLNVQSYCLFFNELQYECAPALEILDIPNEKYIKGWCLQGFGKGTPKLRELVIPRSWILPRSTLFDHLEVLTIPKTAPGDRQPYPFTIHELLIVFAQSAQTLSTINICADRFMKPQPPEPVSFPNLPLLLPRLLELNLPPRPPEWTRELYHSISAPNVQQHTFDLTTLHDLITNNTLPFPSLTVLKIKHDRVVRSGISGSMYATILSRLPWLQELVTCQHTPPHEVLGLHCPQLRRLTVVCLTEVKFSGFKDMVQVRRRRAAVEGRVDSLDEIELQCMLPEEEAAWLQDNMVVFKNPPPALSSLS